MYDQRMQYPLHLLQLGFSKQGITAHVRPSKDVMSQNRALQSLQQQYDVDVVWTMTSTEREQQLLPVRIPIYKGLIGWRVSLLARDRIAQFADVKAREQLQPFSAGQGHDWPDSRILEYNQLKVIGVSNYESLFKILPLHRIDYFPRAVTEIQSEITSHPHIALVIDPYLLIHYPTASYFFFNKKAEALARHLEDGLNKAIADGSFDQLFFQHHAELIKSLQLNGRRIIELHNPLLPPDTPLQRPELWFDPRQSSR